MGVTSPKVVVGNDLGFSGSESTLTSGSKHAGMTDFWGVTVVIPECCYRGSRSFTTTFGEVTYG